MSETKFHAPSICPVCSGNMEITQIRCEKCGAELSGNFSPCKFCKLEEKHLQFIETFLRCRGSIKEVEKALGVSYPTVKNMLDASLTALALNEKSVSATVREDEERAEILEKLHSKEIDVDAAIKALKHLKGEN